MGTAATTGARDPRRTEGGGGEPSGGREPRRTREDEWERMKDELDESDIRACGGFLPLGRTGLASGTLETENGTGLAGGTLGQTENGTGLAGGTLDQAENGTGLAGGTLDQAENGTGLAGGTQIESSVSAVDVGRDDLLGGAVIADCGEVVRVRRPPTAACGGTSPTGGEGEGAVGVGRDDLLRGAVIADCGEAVRVRRPPTAACGGTSPTSGEGAGGESVTNEPERGEEVKSSNYITHIGIMTNSGVDSGLDKGGIDGDFDGGEAADDADCGEAVRVRRPPTAACGGTSPTRVEVKRSVGEAAPTQSVGARGIENSSFERDEALRAPRPPAVGGETAGDGGRRLGGAEATRSVGEAAPTQSVGARGIEKSSSERGEALRTPGPATAGACGEAASASGAADEAELRELQAQLAIETVKRQARAGPMAEAIRDLMASSPEAMEFLKPFLPRGP